jgi:hypothetical protein
MRKCQVLSIATVVLFCFVMIASSYGQNCSSSSPVVCTIWSAGAVPGAVDGGDPSAGEYGVKFRSDVNGSVLGVRFYKASLNTGTHIVNLWTANGNLLASAVVSSETASGWQQFNFSSPVNVAAGTTYVASYFTSTGHYSFDASYFGAAVDAAPLHALANTSSVNGVYRYGSSSGFPTSTYSASNYWVDVAFAPNSTTPPSIASTVPLDASTFVSLGTVVKATFNDSMDPTTIDSSTFLLRDQSNNSVPATVTYDSSSSIVSLKPTVQLQTLTTYTATIKGTVTDIYGNALGSDYSWSFTTGTAPSNSGPGGPILVISSTTNPFSSYYGEILLAEGVNYYTVQDISTVTSSVLSAYDVAILGDMSLTSSQASMLSTWVNAGGNLIAMHPDQQLASVLGLVSTSQTLADAYLRVNTASGPGVGIVDQTIQYHGAADLYSPNGASTLATLYSNATTPTTFPAVTLVSAGSGKAAAFTYDLARSVVYTRQGNPAWSGEQRNPWVDPVINNQVIRPDDLFFGNASFDPQPDWVDLSKVAIPQADEQQRLLVNLISQMNLVKKPLPRFWYFPSGYKAVVIMTGDDHGQGGSRPRFDQYIADSPANCSVEDWQCVRATTYIYTSTPFSGYQAYVADGFEIANHANSNPNCTNWTPASLDVAITSQLAAMAQNYPENPASKTNRTHCVLWSDYDSEPQILLNHGIRFDTTYYYWPDSWIQDVPGLFTGSGMPMRFADRNGNLINVYQATTQIPDEDTWVYPAAIDTLLDNAVGPQGFYAAITANMHTDYAASAGSDFIVASAQAMKVPVVSSLQMLTWVDGRNASSFGSLSWSGNVLSFSISTGTGARNLQAMVPVNSNAGSLASIAKDGTPINYTVQTVKGVSYAFFAAAAGTYRATYGGAGGSLSISGTISGAGGNGAVVALTGSATAFVTADSSGNYSFTGGFASGTYTVTVSNAGYTFSPASAQVTVNATSVAGVNFATATSTYSISGTITGAQVTTVTLGGAATATTVEDGYGNYTFLGLPNGTYTVTPSGSFTPASTKVTVSGANVTGVNFWTPTATFTISGTIYGPGANGATVSLNGGQTTVADTSGNYTFLGLTNGSYTVTPTNAGYVFSPGNRSVTISGANILAVNFSTLTGTLTISGTISGAGGSGATVILGGTASGTTTSDGSGNYSFSSLANGNYTVTPSKAGFLFTPSTTTVPVSGASVTGVNFSSTAQTLAISGNISGPGGNSASLALTGAANATTTADSSGNYIFNGIANGTYTVTPNNSGFVFSPSSQGVTVNGNSITGLNFSSSAGGPNLSSLVLNPTTVTGGTSSTGTVTLSAPAPSGGVIVTLSDNSSSATTPPSVTVAAGLTTATFTVTTAAVGSITGVTVTATYNGASTQASLTINPPVLSSVSLSPTTVTGGTSSTGTVRLNGPAPAGGSQITLSDNSTSAATPANVTVAAGSTSATFTVTTTAVAATTSATVSAAYKALSAQASLTIVPPILGSLGLSPTSVVGGNSSTGTVTLNGPAPAPGIVVTLSDNSSAAQVPASVTVATGSRAATFIVNTIGVGSSTSATITATFGVSRNATLTINVAALSSLVLSPSTVTAGSSTTGTVTLNGTAPPSGAVISLSSSNQTAQVPSSATIPAGARSISFTVTTSPLRQNPSARISGTYRGVTRSATLTIQ